MPSLIAHAEAERTGRLRCIAADDEPGDAVIEDAAAVSPSRPRAAVLFQIAVSLPRFAQISAEAPFSLR